MNTETIASPPAAVEERIAKAIASGIELSSVDIATIRENFAQAEEFARRAARISGASADPMRKGNAFPLGVGFTRMTRSAEKRLDASVRRASEAVEMHRRGETHLRRAEDMLSGKNTEAHRRDSAAAKARAQRHIVERLLSWRTGETFLQFTIKRVNQDRDGYPSSYSIEGPGIIAGHNNKVDVVREFFAGDREAFRRLVDTARAT